SGFHDALVAACDSAWWLRLREQLFLQAERYRRMQISVIEKDRNANAEHKAIFDATIRRKADLACALLSDHLQKTTDHLLMYAPIFKDGELN
ncbi:MAG: FCD domain-containing protein, partial [Pseudomonadota bacterium]